MPYRIECAKGNESGFTLLEVLISIFVFAIGLLGMLGMILNSLKLTSSSNYRTIASQQAYSMADQLRSNILALGSLTAGATTYVSYDSATPTANTACLGVAGCARNDYVNMSVWMWQQQLATTLPGGAGTVCRDSSPASHTPTQSTGSVSNWNCDHSGEYVVKVCWNESRINASQAALGAGGLLCMWTGL